MNSQKLPLIDHKYSLSVALNISPSVKMPGPQEQHSQNLQAQETCIPLEGILE